MELKNLKQRLTKEYEKIKRIEEPKVEKVEPNPEPKTAQNNDGVVTEAKKENKMHDNIKLNQNAVVKKKKKKFC